MRRTLSSSSTLAAVTLACLAPPTEASAAVGGPDAFGYTFVDQADGAVYDYLDITITGTVVGNGDDALFMASLDAPFSFYGEIVDEVRVSSNGFVTSTLGASSNLANSCPLPLGQFGGGFRIAVLHDDLLSTIYYQYFDQAAAAAVGYPGETEGISVFQWVGEHYPAGGLDAIDVEVVLFHDDDALLFMYAEDSPNAGDGATIAIQNAPATIALEYSCNIPSLTPGVTAILFTPGEPPPPPIPDSDCCTASPTDTPGCLDAGCQATVCAGDAYCCDITWDDVCADLALGACVALCQQCGNGMVDPGEDCDDTGESATCDADCTAAACGDEITNATAGETCDEGEETATCDADCTAAECGDAVVNAAAGEECDDAGESKACDDDCTAAACGDGALNATAGEECDDGNRDADDGCAPDCTLESEPGTTGDGSTSGEPTTTGGQDDTAGSSGAEPPTTGPGPVSLGGVDETSGGDETDTDAPGASSPDDGCGCTSHPDASPNGHHAAWTVLALLGLGTLRRRRR